jgi:hypothetical protein
MGAGAWTRTQLAGSRKITQTADSITATWHYQSLTTDPVNDTESDVLTASGSVKVGDFYGPNTFLKVLSVSVSQASGNPLQWFITVVFSTSVPEDSDEVGDDPTDRPPGLSVVQTNQVEPVKVLPDFFDINSGNEILTQNTAGVTYDPPIEREVVDMSIVVTQNFEDFRPADILGFKGAVNSEPWEGFDRGLARIANIAFQELTENGVTFWQRTVEIHVRDKPDNYVWDTVTPEYIYPWQVIRNNEGVQQLTSEGSDREPIIFGGGSADGFPVLEPVGLSDVGRVLNPGETPTLLRWNVYPRKDFAALDLRLD